MVGQHWLGPLPPFRLLIPLPPVLPSSSPPIRDVAGSELPSQIPVCFQPAEGSEDPSASAKRRGEAGYWRRPDAPPTGYAPLHTGNDRHEPLKGGGTGCHPGPSYAGLIGAGEKAKLVSHSELNHRYIS